MEEQLEKVARPYSAWGKFFCRKFKDRVTTRGSLTRSSTLAMVGGRCKLVNNMDERASSSAQRSSCPLPLLSQEVRACSEVEDLLLLAAWHRGVQEELARVSSSSGWRVERSSSSIQVNCSRFDSVTHAAVIFVLY